MFSNSELKTYIPAAFNIKSKVFNMAWKSLHIQPLPNFPFHFILGLFPSSAHCPQVPHCYPLLPTLPLLYKLFLFSSFPYIHPFYKLKHGFLNETIPELLIRLHFLIIGYIIPSITLHRLCLSLRSAV